MENDEFLQRIQEKIERLTDGPVDLRIDHEDANQLQIDLSGEVPRVALGANVYEYSGFARMCIEYVVASIRERRSIDTLEFHLLLARN